jgi:hypothetical protein
MKAILGVAVTAGTLDRAVERAGSGLRLGCALEEREDRDAAVLGANTDTVLRSLRLLREEGLLEFRRGAASPSQGHPNAAPSSSARGSSSTSPATTATASTS